MTPLDNVPFLQVMFFYFILSFVIGPLIGYYFISKTAESMGNGWVLGSIVSIILWYAVGKRMV